MISDGELVTIDGILGWFHDQVEKKQPISPATWIEGCQKVNALLGNLDQDLVGAEMAYRRLRSKLVSDEDTSSAKAETIAKASDEYQNYLLLKAKKKQIESFIQIAKKSVELKHWDI